MGDNGLPILGHMIEMFRGGPDFWLHLYRKQRAGVMLLDSPILPIGGRRWVPTPFRRSTPTATRTSRSKAGRR